VLFVNFQDFQEAIARKIAEEEPDSPCFFTGYDCDSLALEPLSGFASAFLPFMEGAGGATFEFRTKSVRIGPLLARPPLENCVVAFSFTPPAAAGLERGVPPVSRRLLAMERLGEHGWKLGLRFDPLLYHDGFEESYRAFFREVFGRLRPDRLHSVSLGAFRLPVEMHETMERLYPEEKLFAFGLSERRGVVSYRDDLHANLLRFCREEVLRYVPEEAVFTAGG
jgi:spore photoproduct lyase